MSGPLSYHAGRAAERQVAAHYAARGAVVLAERWRGAGGEIDIVLRDGGGLVFVEVKTSRCVEMAALRLTQRQIDRVSLAGAEFAAREGYDAATPMRVDAALVGRDGGFQVIENVTLH